MNLQDKFTAANDYLVNAILEKMLGRLPSREELRQGITIKFDPIVQESRIFWKSQLILISSMRLIDHDGEGTKAITGSFEVPVQYVDEWIQKRIDEWML